jgi:hypothetical protein
MIQEGGQIAISSSADFTRRKLMDQESQIVMEPAAPVILEFDHVVQEVQLPEIEKV